MTTAIGTATITGTPGATRTKPSGTARITTSTTPPGSMMRIGIRGGATRTAGGTTADATPDHWQKARDHPGLFYGAPGASRTRTGDGKRQLGHTPFSGA